MNDLTDSMTLNELRNNAKSSINMEILLKKMNRLNNKIAELSEHIELIGRDM